MKISLIGFGIISLFVVESFGSSYRYCPESAARINSYGSTFNKSLSFKLDCAPPDIGRMCKAAEKECLAVSGRTDCSMGMRMSITCDDLQFLTEEQVMQKRADNFNYIQKKFYEITADSTLQTRCCGTDQTCKEGWSKTKLNILKGLSQSTLTAEVTWDNPPVVQMSVSIIAQCQSTDCIDRLLYHELGHACSTWSSHFGNDVPRTFQSAAILENKIHSYLTKTPADCVIKGLKRARDYEGIVNFDSWTEEALADSIFAHKMGPGAIAYMCNARQEKMHAHPKYYIACFLDEPSFKEKFCLNSKAPSESVDDNQSRVE